MKIRPEFLEKKDDQLIGEGGFSKVYLVHSREGLPFASKVIELNSLSLKDRRRVKREIKIIKQLNSEFVVKYFKSFKKENLLYIIQEFCSNGNIFRFIPPEGLPHHIVSKIFFNIIQCVKHLHQNGIIHGDIKPENFLFNQNFQIKICDFGHSFFVGQEEKGITGTYEYMSPESLENQLKNEKSDIWSMGILLYELLHGRAPW